MHDLVTINRVAQIRHTEMLQEAHIAHQRRANRTVAPLLARLGAALTAAGQKFIAAIAPSPSEDEGFYYNFRLATKGSL